MSEESTEAVELARHGAHLSTVEEQDAPYTISGIAIGEGDVTLGQSGIKKKWTREALKPAADSLEGRPLVVDHNNSAYGVVGEVTRVEYQNGVGVLYEAELDDEDLAEKVENGRLEVSIRGFHPDVEEMEENESGAKLITAMKFDNLSIVPSGAAPSNTATIGGMGQTDNVEAADKVTVEAGPSTNLTAAECADLLNPEEEEEAAKRSEGAEKLEDETKYEQMPERYSEEDDVTKEEASEQEDEGDSEELGEDADGQGTEDEPTSPHDEAEEAEQSGGAGTDEGPDSTFDNVTFIQPNMTDEDQLSEYDDPTIMEGSDLEELREQASKVDDLEEQFEELQDAQETSDDEASEIEELKEELKGQFESDLEELKERTRVLDEVDRSDVDELAETDDPMVVEAGEYESLQESVDEVRSVYAESLADHVALGADTIEDKFSISEMQEQLEEFADSDDVTEELSPDLKGDDPEEEELEDAAEADEEELSETEEDAEAKRAELREKILN